MTNEKKSTQKFDFEIEYNVNREGKTEKLLLNDIPFDVYKAAKPSFIENPDKAIRIIVSACGEENSKNIAISHIDSGNFVAISSLESGIAGLITPIPAELKKK